MPNLYSSKEVIKVVEKLGYNFHSQRGLHGKYKSSRGTITIIPMNKKEIPEGTLRSILKQVGIDKLQFIKLL